MSLHQPQPRLGVLPASPQHQPRAEALALETGEPVITLSEFANGACAAALIIDDQGLALAPSPSHLPNVSPVRIDLKEWESFARRPVSFRQPLARAAGVVSRATAPDAIDATAGLLTDALHLAFMGCRVTAIERSPIVHAIAADALQRAAASPTLSEPVGRITLLRADARAHIEGLPQDRLPGVVFIDPMHPPRDRNASALVRKDMRILRLAVGDDADAPALVRAALARLSDPRARVILKLPLRARSLEGLAPPTHVHEAKTVRYEVHKPVHAPGLSSR